MRALNHKKTVVVFATVNHVLPKVGLAYLLGDDHREWTVTKSTCGEGLASLQPGQRLELTVERHDRFAVVSKYHAAA
jgi:hypothetical protein